MARFKTNIITTPAIDFSNCSAKTTLSGAAGINVFAHCRNVHFVAAALKYQKRSLTHCAYKGISYNLGCYMLTIVYPKSTQIQFNFNVLKNTFDYMDSSDEHDFGLNQKSPCNIIEDIPF